MSDGTGDGTVDGEGDGDGETGERIINGNMMVY